MRRIKSTTKILSLFFLFLVTISLSAQDNASRIIEVEDLMKSLAYNTDNTKVKIYDWKIENGDASLIKWDEGAVNFSEKGFERKGELYLGNHRKITHHTVADEVENGKWELYLIGDKEKIIYVEIKPNAITQEKPAFDINTIYIQDKIVCKDTPENKITFYSIKLPKKELFWMEKNTTISSKGSASSYIISYCQKPTCTYVPQTIASTSSKDQIDRFLENKILNALKQFEKTNTYGFTLTDDLGAIDLKHELIGIYDIPYAGKHGKLGLAYTNSERNNDCHACSPRISFFLFVMNNGQWGLEVSDINAESIGSWGNPPSKDAFKVIEIGKDIYGIVIDTSYGNQGCFSDYRAIYQPMNGKFKEIFSDEIAYDSTAFGTATNSSWKSNFAFRQSNGYLYDIIMRSNGTKDGVSFKKETIYKFDGTKYYSSSVQNNSEVNVNNILTYSNIKSFIDNLLQSNCFRHEQDVSIYYTDNVKRFFSFTNPTHKMIYDDNVKYCRRWPQINYTLQSLQIIEQYNKNSKSYADITIDIGFYVANRSKERRGTSRQHMTLVVENGKIKVESASAQSIKSTPAAQNDAGNYLKNYAHELMTGRSMSNQNDIIVKYNSKGIKIYCLSNMKMCKTEAEVKDYFKNR